MGKSLNRIRVKVIKIFLAPFLGKNMVRKRLNESLHRDEFLRESFSSQGRFISRDWRKEKEKELCKWEVGVVVF